MNKKAQITTETIIVISILLIFLTIIILYSFSQKSLIESLQENKKKENECLRLSMIVSSIYNSEENSYLETKTDYNVFFGLNFIAVNDVNTEALKGIYCNHQAKLNAEKNINNDSMLIYNENNKVIISNA